MFKPRGSTWGNTTNSSVTFQGKSTRIVLEVSRGTGFGSTLAITLKTWTGLKLDSSETITLTSNLENLLINGGELLLEGHPNVLKGYLKDELVISYKYAGSIGAFVAASNDAVSVTEKHTKKGRLLALTSAITSSVDSHKPWGLNQVTIGDSSSIWDNSSYAKNTDSQPFTPATMNDGSQKVTLQSITAMDEYKNMYAHHYHHQHHHYHHHHH